MAYASIHGKERTLAELLESIIFQIPHYQRPYRWGIEHVDRLLGDVFYMIADDTPLDQLPTYFLGNMVFVKSQVEPDAQVLDGQQRLITLMVIICLLRDQLRESNPALCDAIRPYITSGAPGGFVRQRPRLYLRESDNDFFREHVIEEGGPNHVCAETELKDAQSETQRNIRDNLLHIRTHLQKLDDAKIYRFVNYLFKQCMIVGVQTDDEDAAIKIFTVLSETGMPMSHADIIKADVLREIPDRNKRRFYALQWEEMEKRIGGDPFREMFSYLRVIKLREKSRETIVKDFRERIFRQGRGQPLTGGGENFIQNTLKPYGKALLYILGRQEPQLHPDFADKIKRQVYWLHQFGRANREWFPPAMCLWREYAERDQAILLHSLKLLERLMFVMLLTGVWINRRVSRLNSVIQDIDNCVDFDSPAHSLQLKSEGESSEALEAIRKLDGDIYHHRHVKYLLMRLDSDLSDYPIQYGRDVTIEHVLPQNPQPRSQWTRWFKEKHRVEWTHKLGNLVLLTRSKNGKAGRLTFDDKKTKYFKTTDNEGKVTTCALTVDVLSCSEWTPEILVGRHRKLLERCCTIWRLGEMPSAAPGLNSSGELFTT